MRKLNNHVARHNTKNKCNNKSNNKQLNLFYHKLVKKVDRNHKDLIIR